MLWCGEKAKGTSSFHIGLQTLKGCRENSSVPVFLKPCSVIGGPPKWDSHLNHLHLRASQTVNISSHVYHDGLIFVLKEPRVGGRYK
jgi:hypothetical protein